MACMNALCRRLKKIFSSEKPMLGTAVSAGPLESTVSLNPYVPAQEAALAQPAAGEEADKLNG